MQRYNCLSGYPFLCLLKFYHESTLPTSNHDLVTTLTDNSLMFFYVMAIFKGIYFMRLPPVALGGKF